MKLQDILTSLLLAYFTFVLWSYFWSPKSPVESLGMRQGQELTLIKTDQLCHPVKTEIDFYNGHSYMQAATEVITGYNADLGFSTAGGVLENFIFKRDVAGVEKTIATIIPPTYDEREKGLFLIGLNEMTPFNFTLIERQNDEDAARLVYESSTLDARIRKEFIVSLHNYRIDLVITLEPLQNDHALKPRIFIPGPVMQDIAEQEKIAGIVLTDLDKLKKITAESTSGVAWVAPKLLGVEDRYFIYSLVQDNDHFTQRAFFKRGEHNQLTAILEGPEIKQTTTWKLSFYCGPKELHELVVVDARLDEVMEYGWFAFISKPLLWLLNFIYKYVRNYGWAIIIITVLMRLMLLPFTRRGEKKMKRGSAHYAQKLKYIEQKYKNDPEGLAREKEALTREHLSSMTGCLPLLLQIPVFIGLNYVLRNAIELYHAPFILWIKDLSARDPYYVIPACLGLTAFLAMSGQAKDPRHKVALFIAAMVLAGVTANISAGLGLFLVVSGFLGVMQTQALKKVA